MQKRFFILLAACLLAGLLGGCAAAEETVGSAADALEKAQEVELWDGAGNLLCTLTDLDEIDALFGALLDEAGWELEGQPEDGLPVELAAVFLQRPTQTVFGPRVEEDDREEVLRLTIYEGSDIAELRMLPFPFFLELPDGAREALRAAAGLQAAA